MADKRYRLNLDFDNTILPFLYGGAGEWTFKVPSAPNFAGGRYVVYLPCAMVLTEVDKIPQISGFTRIEEAVPSVGEFRTIKAEDYATLLLKDAIEFNSADAGTTLTITNLWTVGSTVSPDVGDSYTDDKEGFNIYTGRGTGTNSHVTDGILYCGPGYCVVNGVEVVNDEVKTLTPPVELTTGYWYLIYVDSTGNYHFEITSNNTANIFPEAQVNTLAPVRNTGLARYQVGNPDRRLIGCARASSGTLFHDKVFNLPEPTFGTGCLGDVTLDGTGLGATATPLRGLDEAGEYHFDNLTINGTCFCGNINGASCKPTVIRVRGTLTIGASGQLNGTTRGENGGAGGAGATATNILSGSGGSGGKSGRPIHIFANRIIVLRSAGFWITTRAGAGSNGGNGSGSANSATGGGGGGGSSSGLILVTNSEYSHLSSTLIDFRMCSIGGLRGLPQSVSSTAFGGYGGSVDEEGITPYLPSGNGTSGLPSTAVSRGNGGGRHGGQDTTAGLGGVGFNGGGGGGTFGAGGGGGGATTNGGNGSVPTHFPLNYITIIPSYSSRRGI